MRPVVVDTSVWRRYLSGDPETRPLADLLDEDGRVLLHPMVLGELVLGGLAQREEELLRWLPLASLVSEEEVLGFVRQRALARAGIGWVDAHLLASSLVV